MKITVGHLGRMWDTHTPFVRAQGMRRLVNVYVGPLTVTVRDHRVHRALLSERMPEHFRKREWAFHIGTWHIGVSRTWRTSR